MAKQPYYRTAALLGAQPLGKVQQRRQVAHPLQIPWKWIAVAVVLAGLPLWAWLDARWYVDATRLQVAGASLDTAREVVLKANVLGLHGLWLRSTDVVSEVLAVPAVTEAEVECWAYPAQCLITVEERLPVLVWQATDGPHWIAADGTVFAARGERPDLPLVRGPLPDPVKIPEAVLQGVDALLALGVPSGSLGYNAPQGLFWDDPEGRLVIFGTGPEMAPRWRVYQALVANLEARGVFPWTLDVRFPQAPTYSMDRPW